MVKRFEVEKMKNDLISRKKLMDFLKSYKFGAISNEVERNCIKQSMLDLVNRQPTAYEEDKIIKELEKRIEIITPWTEDDIFLGEYRAYHDAIGIVRKGGK